MSTPTLNGWFKVYRDAVDDAVWGTPPSTVKVWMTCLAKARHQDEPGRWDDGDEVVEIPKGAWLTSYEKVAKLAGVSREVARNALRQLKRLGLISPRSKPGHWIIIQTIDWQTYKANTSKGNHESNTPTTRRDPYLEKGEKEENISKENIGNRGLETLGVSSTREENDISLFGETVGTKDRRLDAASHTPQQNQRTFSRSGSPDESSAGSSVRPSWYAREAQRKAEEARRAVGLAEDSHRDGKEYRYLYALAFAVGFAEEALEEARQGKLDLRSYETLLEETRKKLTEASQAMGIDPSDSRFDDLALDPFGGEWSDALDQAEETFDPAKVEARRLAEEHRRIVEALLKEQEIRGYAEAAKAKAEEARKANAEGQPDSMVYGLFTEATRLAWRFIDDAIGPEWKEEVGEMREKLRGWEVEHTQVYSRFAMRSQKDRTGYAEAFPQSPTLPNKTNRQNDGDSPPEDEKLPW
jgi:hypothetical protein